MTKSVNISQIGVMQLTKSKWFRRSGHVSLAPERVAAAKGGGPARRRQQLVVQVRYTLRAAQTNQRFQRCIKTHYLQTQTTSPINMFGKYIEKHACPHLTKPINSTQFLQRKIKIHNTKILRKKTLEWRVK